MLTFLTVLVILRASGYFAYALFSLPLDHPNWHLEPKMVHLAWRVQSGLDLYPSWKDYPHIANFYGPLYFWIVGILASLQLADLGRLFLIGRLVTFSSALLTSVTIGGILWHRYGRWPGVIGAIATLGSAPMIGFSVSVRSDTTAELIALCGFLLGTRSSRLALLAGGCLLSAAMLTRQTTAVFCLAAAFGLFWQGRRRHACALCGATAALMVLSMAVVTSTFEPNFAKSLFGEAGSPFDVHNWTVIMIRLLTHAPDLLILPVLGIVMWTTGKPADVHFVALGGTLLVVSILFTFKVGSDLNYFLSLRLLEGIAVASLAAGATGWFARHSKTLLVMIYVSALSLFPGIATNIYLAQKAQKVRSESEFERSLRTQYQQLFDLAEQSSVRLLTDSPTIALRQGNRAAFVDPLRFRQLVESGRVRPEQMRQWLEARQYQYVILTADVRDPGYEQYPFGLPAPLVEPIRRSYVFAGRVADLFVFTPQAPTSSPEPPTR